MFVIALVAINLALIFYSIGVWAERAQRRLTPWHVVFFGLGLACDTTGTLVMVRLAQQDLAAGAAASASQTLMAWTGTLAIALMALHFLWAIVTLIRGRESELMRFHTFSVAVWAIWLVPYLAGALAPMIG